MRLPKSNEMMTALLSGLLSFVLIGCSQFPDGLDFAAQKPATALNGAQTAATTPDVARGAAH